MNGDIKIEGRSAIVTGPNQLQGAEVSATDLRAGSALVLAGLVGEGVTQITGLEHIDRGYVDFAEKLRALGCDVERCTMETEETDEAPQEVKATAKAKASFKVNPNFA